VSIEIYNVIDRALGEVQSQYCKEDADVNAELGNTLPDHSIFQLFLAVLYQRLTAVVEAHSFVIDCSHALIQSVMEVNPAKSGFGTIKLKGGEDSDPGSNRNISGSFNKESNDEDEGLSAESMSSSANDLGSLRDSKPGEIRVYALREVAIFIQNEVKGLLYDYLKSSDNLASASIPPVLAITEMLKENKKGLKRQIKVLFIDYDYTSI
jgi:hypothetical protein